MAGRIAVALGNRQKQVFCGNKFILETIRFFECLLEDIVQRAAHVLLGEPLHFRQASELAFNLLSEGLGTNTKTGEQGRHHAIGLRHQCREQVNRLNLLILMLCSRFLGALHGLLSLYRHFFKSQHRTLDLNSVPLYVGCKKGLADRQPLFLQLTSLIAAFSPPPLTCRRQPRPRPERSRLP